MKGRAGIPYLSLINSFITTTLLPGLIFEVNKLLVVRENLSDKFLLFLAQRAFSLAQKNFEGVRLANAGVK